MLNTMIVAAITNFSGTTTPDKNGEAPVMLQCIAGTMPNRNVLSGTVARRAGLEIGRTYLVNVRETGFDDLYGPDYTFIKIMELTNGLDIVRAAKEIGDARIMFVLRPEGFSDSYRRKGNAIESSRTKRIREGHYHPSIPTTVIHHETATEVVDGTSVGSGGTVVREKPERFGEGNEGMPTEVGGPTRPTPRSAGNPDDNVDSSGQSRESRNRASAGGRTASRSRTPIKSAKAAKAAKAANPRVQRSRPEDASDMGSVGGNE
jgi:hypothetical protein